MSLTWPQLVYLQHEGKPPREIRPGGRTFTSSAEARAYREALARGENDVWPSA